MKKMIVIGLVVVGLYGPFVQCRMGESNVAGAIKSLGKCSEADRCCVGRDSSCVANTSSYYGPPCYCDEGCIETGDCCSDYKEICNIEAVDCEVTEWSEWSGCSASCGKGTESRSRLVTQHPSSGGDDCPPLTQKRGCLGSRCSDVHKKYKNPIRETAGLLPAKYYLSLHSGEPKWDVRENLFMRNKYLAKQKDVKTNFLEGYQADQPKDLEDNKKKVKSYCIVFELEKVTKACKRDKDFLKMELGLQMCALCPADSRLDSLGGRCRGHGVDSQPTRWRSTVQPKCHGKWRRVHELEDCPCEEGPDFVFV